MKKLLSVTLGALVIAGCASTTPESKTNVRTYGLLICQPDELCPIVTVIKNESLQDAIKIQIALNSINHQYDIKKVVFTNGVKSLSFNTIGPTDVNFQFGSNRSRNSIIVPNNMIHDLSVNHNISMNIYTDQGMISRYILKDGVKAPLVQELQQAYKK